MKIGETRPIAPAGGVTRKSSRGRSADGDADSARQIVDITSIMGIPEEELTDKVRDALQSLMAEVERLRGELESTHRKVSYLEGLADEDSLVPVINRRAFVRELSRMMAYVERYGTPHSVLFFDIDGLKAINDTYGHAAGDEALKHAAKILMDSVRETDLVGRLGGDEFGVILAQMDKKQADEKAAVLAQALRAQPLVWKGHKIPLSLAYGAYTMKSGENANDALHAADRAMYEHKRRSAG
jgi:diguanylate cyclase (GGDEF)-like protein